MKGVIEGDVDIAGGEATVGSSTDTNKSTFSQIAAMNAGASDWWCHDVCIAYSDFVVLASTGSGQSLDYGMCNKFDVRRLFDPLLLNQV